MNYVIESAFAYQGVHYGPGEKVPEGMSAAEKEEFFRGGKLAKVEGGKVIRFQRKVELNDVQIDMLLTQPLAIMEATLKSGSFSKETLGKILVRAIQMNLPKVAGVLKESLKPKDILQSAKKIGEKPKKEEKKEEEKKEEGKEVEKKEEGKPKKEEEKKEEKEEFKCSCGKKFDTAKKLHGHKIGSGHK